MQIDKVVNDVSQIDSNLPRALVHNLSLHEDTLLNGEVRSKKDIAFECVGLVDELSANVAYDVPFPQNASHLILKDGYSTNASLP